MKEILHHPGIQLENNEYITAYYSICWSDIIQALPGIDIYIYTYRIYEPINWCRISSINSITILKFQGMELFRKKQGMYVLNFPAFSKPDTVASDCGISENGKLVASDWRCKKSV